MSTPIWTLLSPKGGAGKTTLALILAGEFARRGQNVVIIDADPNQPVVRWKSKDNGPVNIEVIADEHEDGKTMIDNIERAQKDADIVIIDTEGTNNLRASTAIAFSDLVLIPVQSCTDDLIEGAKAVEFVTQTGRAHRRNIPNLIVRTLMDPAIIDREEKVVAKALEEMEANVCTASLMRRSAYKTLKTLGCTLYTFDKTEAANLKKAKDNASALFEALVWDYQMLISIGRLGGKKDDEDTNSNEKAA